MKILCPKLYWIGISIDLSTRRGHALVDSHAKGPKKSTNWGSHTRPNLSVVGPHWGEHALKSPRVSKRTRVAGHTRWKLCLQGTRVQWYTLWARADWCKKSKWNARPQSLMELSLRWHVGLSFGVHLSYPNSFN